MTTMFLESAYSRSPPAIAISCSTVIVAGQRIGSAACATLPVMKTFRLLISLTTTVTFGSSTNFDAASVDLLAQLVRRQAGRLNVVQQRQRDLAVRPDHHVGRHVLVSPEHDRQHVVRTDHVAGRQRNRRVAVAAAGGVWRRALRAAGCCARPGRTTSAARAKDADTLWNRMVYHANTTLRHYCRYSLNGS